MNDEWMDHDDPLETRMFYELMYRYRTTPPGDQGPVIEAFEAVKQFVREHYTVGKSDG
jgi:hypothetical protein